MWVSSRVYIATWGSSGALHFCFGKPRPSGFRQATLLAMRDGREAFWESAVREPVGGALRAWGRHGLGVRLGFLK